MSFLAKFKWDDVAQQFAPKQELPQAYSPTLSGIVDSAFHAGMRLASLLSIFDWVTPAIAIGDDVAHGAPFNIGEAWAFNIPYEEAARNGWAWGDIFNLMQANGIDTWGGFFNFGHIRFNVPIEQAAWAEYCLKCCGVPIHPGSQGAPQVGEG